MHDDPAGAERMTAQLASLLRSALDGTATPLVTLEAELRVVRAYLDIERVRFGERLRYTVDVADGTARTQVPRMALQTLIENSVKYAVSPRREGGSIHVRASAASGRIRVTVEDDGPGFDGDDRPAGHGLDLLAGRLRMLFGDRASLDVDSRAGRSSGRIPNPESRIPTVVVMTLRVYLVDDERLAVDRLKRLLEATGRVTIAGASTDPEAALDFLSSHPVDVVFLDIQMPGLTGFELLERLDRDVAVVFTTAYDRYAIDAFSVNSIDYLLKPIEPDRLERALDKVERLIPGTGLRGSRGDLSPMQAPNIRALARELAAALRGTGPDRQQSGTGVDESSGERSPSTTRRPVPGNLERIASRDQATDARRQPKHLVEAAGDEVGILDRLPHHLGDRVRAVTVEDLHAEVLGGEVALNARERASGGSAEVDLRDRVELLVHEVVRRGVADVDADAGDRADVDEPLLGVARGELFVRRAVGDNLEAVAVWRDVRRTRDE